MDNYVVSLLTHMGKYIRMNRVILLNNMNPAGADPGFLKRGFICLKVCVCGGGGEGFLCRSYMYLFFLSIPLE